MHLVIAALDCIIEGDAVVFLKAIWNEDFSYLEYGYVIDDILVLNRDFHFSSFCHVKRLGNIVAHYLAKRSKSGVKLRVWFDTTLDDIAPLVLMMHCNCLVFLFLLIKFWPLGQLSQPKKQKKDLPNDL